MMQINRQVHVVGWIEALFGDAIFAVCLFSIEQFRIIYNYYLLKDYLLTIDVLYCYFIKQYHKSHYVFRNTLVYSM